MSEQDLYEILGVPRDASPALIKKVFRSKARHCHPDAGGDPAEFLRLKQAYDVLIDPDDRRHYDETGETPEDAEVGAAETAHFRSLAGELLVTVITQAGAPQFTDILQELRDAIGLQLSVADRQLVTLSHSAARIGEVLQRLNGPNDEVLVTGLLQERLKDIERKIKLARALKRQLVRLQEKLELYSYDVEVESIL